MGRLILVSNRLPVKFEDGPNGKSVTRSSGGLITGLDPLHNNSDSIWIGYPETELDDNSSKLLTDMRLEPVDIPSDEYAGYYEGFSNGAIWPLFHYLLEYCEFNPEAFAAYKRVNERFAEKILEHAQDDDTIWVHDYQLMFVPAMLREKLPSARIGFFLHIPFPSSEVLRVMPQREELLRGLLGADLIGVHTHEYADHLSRSFRRILGLEASEKQRSPTKRNESLLNTSGESAMRKSFSVLTDSITPKDCRTSSKRLNLFSKESQDGETALFSSR